MSDEDIVGRFKMFGMAVVIVFVGGPLLVLAIFLNVCSWFLILMDLPIWLMTGKTPFLRVAKWADEAIGL